MNERFAFLKSIRFWKIVGAVVVQALVAYGVIDVIIGNSISTILGLDVLVRTVDRHGEKTGDTDTK